MKDLYGESQNMFPEMAGDAMVDAHLADKAEKAAEEVAASEAALAKAYEEQQRRAVSTTSGQTEEPELDYFEFNRRFNELEDSNEPNALTNFLRGENQAITNPEPEVPSTGDPITDRYLNNEEYVDNADNLQEADRQALANWISKQPAQANTEENRELDNISQAAQEENRGVGNLRAEERQALVNWINSQPAQANEELGNTNRTDLTDYEINNNQMVENTRKYQENVEVAEQFAQQTRDAEAAQRATIPDYLLRDSNAVPPTQPIEEKND